MAVKTSTFVAARMLRAACILSMLSLYAVVAAAQQTAAPTNAPAIAPVPIAPAARPPVTTTPPSANAASLAAKPDIRPLWTELTPTQQQILGPLAPGWNKLDSNHKSKWLVITEKYAAMTPEQQKRLEDNIRDWAKLTPEQHRLARESYARAKKLNAEQKTAQWEQYQQLPEDQKKKLAADAATKKRIANMPSLQNKPKTVEPLKSPKKSIASHNPTTQQPGANHAGLPPLTPSASTSATSTAAAPQVQTTAPAAVPLPSAVHATN
ncbi:MAG TPA: DUF3106 domain-containing protein, partial [Burkholderiaceae bacterium]|nr:DUF3106 domain-containing protein [Burkholderiaceae bacterium]